MRILRIRPGFQADHSSSSYLFYAVDGEVGAEGQRAAHRYSSRAEVSKRFARYQKWGESELGGNAYDTLLGKYYDVMAAESYDSWTLMIAVPQTPQMDELLKPFHDLDDREYVRVDVHKYGQRLAIEVFCELDYDGPVFGQRGDPLKELVKLLAEIRAEILQGDVSFLQAVAEFYSAGGEDEEDSEEVEAGLEPSSGWTRDQLMQECVRRGIDFRKSWTKDQLRRALIVPAATPPRPASAGSARGGARPKLSRAAQKIVKSLERV